MGTLVRVRPGIYAPGDRWHNAKPEEQITDRACALAMVSKARPVFSHETAAAIHGLPLFHADTSRVHVIAPPDRPGAAAGVVRHRGSVCPADLVEIDGLLCTSLLRTSADVARTLSFEQAVTVADAALRRVAVRGPGTYDHEAADGFAAAARVIATRSPHGQTRARRALAFADGRAQLPGESISRIRLHELGFRDIRLQVGVDGPAGSRYFVDFGLEEVRAFGEFDGRMKYLDGRLTNGRTASEVVEDEKKREDWIRGTTQRRYVRWGWAHLATSAELGRRLEAFGIRPAR